MVRAPRKRTTERPDPYADVIARITAALERGTVPWRHPWRSRGLRNALSNRPYRGINLLMLGLVALEQRYDDPRWLTYRQAEQIGGHVRRGEHGTRVVLWKWLERPDRTDDEPVDRFPLMRLYTVFNVAQCDGLELADPDAGIAFDPVQQAEAIAGGYADGPAVLDDADAAYYVPSRDEVHLPPRPSFRAADAYYATLFHEIGTGASVLLTAWTIGVAG